jgi:hypothetical protein
MHEACCLVRSRRQPMRPSLSSRWIDCSRCSLELIAWGSYCHEPHDPRPHAPADLDVAGHLAE